MDAATALSVSGWLDKYGPMGCSLIVCSLVLIGLVWKVIPTIAESHGKRLEAITNAFQEAMTKFGFRMDKHETLATDRHSEIMGKLQTIDGKVSPKPPSIPAVTKPISPVHGRKKEGHDDHA